MRIFNRKRSKVPEDAEMPIKELIAELPQESQIFLRSWQCVADTAMRTDDRALSVICVIAVESYTKALYDCGFISEDEMKRIRSEYKMPIRAGDDEGEVAIRAMRHLTRTTALLKRTHWAYGLAKADENK